MIIYSVFIPFFYFCFNFPSHKFINLDATMAPPKTSSFYYVPNFLSLLLLKNLYFTTNSPKKLYILYCVQLFFLLCALLGNLHRYITEEMSLGNVRLLVLSARASNMVNLNFHFYFSACFERCEGFQILVLKKIYTS